MNAHDWIKEFPAAINVCDKNGNLLELNDKAVKLFENVGGEKLIGTNILNCHDEHSRNKFEEMLKKPTVNYYLSEKNGNKKFIYQSPWYKDGAFMGYTEFVIEIPFDIPFRKFEKE